MSNKENKSTSQEKTRKVIRLDDDQIDGVTGGMRDIGNDTRLEANPFGKVERIKVYNIDDKVRENG